VGGVPDVIEDGVSGLLVPPKDPGAMANAILRLLRDDALRRSLGERARLAVYPKYDVSRLIGDMKDLYSKLKPRSVAEGSWM
jgi:glycosyltransferase involved in cell wall biosynthesis